MYTIIRKYYIVPGSEAELKRRIQTEFEPLLSRMPGFVAYYLLEVRADEVASVSIFDSKDQADASTSPSALWMRDCLADFVQGLPEIIAGHTEVYSSVQERSSQGDRQKVVTVPWWG